MRRSPSAALASDALGARPARRVDGHRRQLRQAHALSTKLLGRFNAENVAGRARLSAGARRAARSERPRALAAMHGAARPHGGDRSGGAAASRLAVVDYAHTPDALGQGARAPCASTAGARCGACLAAAAIAMPASARSWAPSPTNLPTEIIVTDDNPRSESPQHISARHPAGIKAHPCASHSRSRRGDRRRAQGGGRRGCGAHRRQGP